MNGKTIAKKLHEIQNCISGANNHPEIREMLLKFGFDQSKIKEGQVKLEKVNNLMARQVDLYGDQYAATEETVKNREKAYSEYMILVKVIRVALKDDIDSLKSFLATGQRSRSLSGWLREARIAYTNILNSASAMDRLKIFGITSDKIKDGLKQVEEIESLYSKQLGKKGDAQQSTIERDQAFDDLANWYSDFRAIARIALYEKPQLLEVLGIVKK